MEYTIGSLAELISGINTPNKQKVVKKRISRKEKVQSEAPSEDDTTTPPQPIKKVKKPRKEIVNNDFTQLGVDQNGEEESAEPFVKKSKHKGFENGDESWNRPTSELYNEQNVQRRATKKNKWRQEEFGDEGELWKKPKSDLSENEQNAQRRVTKKDKWRQEEFRDEGESWKKPKSDLSENEQNAQRPVMKKNKWRQEEFGDEGESWRKPKSELSENERNAQRRITQKGAEENPEKRVEDPEISARTLFIGNVPVNLSKKKILQYFKKYGQVDSIRIRGIAPENPKVTKKIAAIKNQLHPKRNSVLCYIRYKNKEDCLKALVENGKVFEGHHLRVSTCEQKTKPDEAKAIFVGNLNFDAEEEELWEIFKDCGPISYVRIIRDSQTMMGKGFAYVNFRDSDSVQLAIEMENVKLRDRELRISLCNSNVARKNKSSDNKKQITKSGKPKKMRWRNRDKKTDGDVNSNIVDAPVQQKEDQESHVVEKKKKRKRVDEDPVQQSEEHQNSQVVDGKKKRKKLNDDNVNTFPVQHSKEYQGSQFTDKKKKHKVNKGLLEKKKKIKQIAPK